jgi:Chromate transporter
VNVQPRTDSMKDGEAAKAATGGSSVGEVFADFIKLGLTSFGGPIAHLGYFRTEFVERRRGIDETEFARLLALCQFLPGPASSQGGFPAMIASQVMERHRRCTARCSRFRRISERDCPEPRADC